MLIDNSCDSFCGSDGAVPVMTIILGGNLVKGDRQFMLLICSIYSTEINYSVIFCYSYSGLKGSGIKTSIIVWIIVVRYVLLPIAGILIVKTAIHLGLINSDPLYQFVLLLQYTLPPAMNLGMAIFPSLVV